MCRREHLFFPNWEFAISRCGLWKGPSFSTSNRMRDSFMGRAIGQTQLLPAAKGCFLGRPWLFVYWRDLWVGFFCQSYWNRVHNISWISPQCPDTQSWRHLPGPWYLQFAAAFFLIDLVMGWNGFKTISCDFIDRFAVFLLSGSDSSLFVSWFLLDFSWILLPSRASLSTEGSKSTPFLVVHVFLSTSLCLPVSVALHIRYTPLSFLVFPAQLHFSLAFFFGVWAIYQYVLSI